MTTLKMIAGRLALMGAGAAAMLAAGVAQGSAQEQSQSQLPQGWFKACTKQADVDMCNVQYRVVASTGQIIGSVNLMQLSGKVNQKVVQITVPLGRLVPAGIQLQIDNNQPRKLDYKYCMPDTCIAEAPLTDDLVNALKKGQQITATSVNFQNQPNPMPMTLAGFTAAFDGPALQQSDLEEKNQQVQDFVKRNTENFSKRLQDAQDASKKAD